MSEFNSSSEQSPVAVLDLPAGAVPVPGNVLAAGSSTGHSHRVVGEGTVVFDVDGMRFVRAPKGGQILHDEHKPITLDPLVGDDYCMGHEKEFDHFTEESRDVID